MELRINPFPKNNYPKKGLLIKGSSPLTWLHEMEISGIDLSWIQSFPIPSNEPNVLYGCFLVFNHSAPQDIGRNSYFQCVDDKLFIPENTIFYPKIIPEDWQNTDAEFLIMHPEFGLVKLSEQIDWVSLLQESEKAQVSVRKPLNGVKIPQRIERYTVEMDDEKVMEALQTPQTEAEWMKNLPFDLKKVMAGNKKEIEKYLKYIEKYPDRAIDLGVPLDIMGTSRGDGFGKFKFENSWLGKFFGQNNSGLRDYRWLLLAFWIIFVIAKLSFNSDKQETEVAQPSSGTVLSGDALKNQPSDILAFESGLTEIDLKIDSLYRKERTRLINEYSTAASMESKDKKQVENYKKQGGKTVSEVGKEIEKFKNKENKTRDFLKKIYSQKIKKHIEQKSESYQRKISDSLEKAHPWKPVNKGIVKSIWKKKQVLIEDSLGRLYGTLENPQLSFDKKSNSATTDNSGDAPSKKDVSFFEIIWLIAFIMGSIGIYTYFFRKKSLNIGGDNVPAGIKIFLAVVLLAMLIYLFYPLIEMFGYNWFVWILVICVVLLLYRLFSEDKTILKSDENE